MSLFLSCTTSRNLTSIEAELMTWTLSRVFECRLSEYPISMLTSSFWQRYQNSHMTTGKEYTMCLFGSVDDDNDDDNVHGGLDLCLEHLREPCPRSYVTIHKSGLQKCQSILFHNGTWSTADDDRLWTPYLNDDFNKFRPNFAQYFECLGNFESRVRACAKEHLDKPCSTSPLRVVKTVRAPMEVARRLFRLYPKDLRLVHLLRDPRGVTLSRLRTEWAHGYFERQDPDPRMLADSYCRNSLRDVHERKILEAMHKGQIFEVLYDNFMEDPKENAKELFFNIGMGHMFPKSEHVIRRKIDEKRKDRWKSWLNPDDIEAIEKACPTFLKAYKLEMHQP